VRERKESVERGRESRQREREIKETVERKSKERELEKENVKRERAREGVNGERWCNDSSS